MDQHGESPSIQSFGLALYKSLGVRYKTEPLPGHTGHKHHVRSGPFLLLPFRLGMDLCLSQVSPYSDYVVWFVFILSVLYRVWCS